VEPTLLVDVTNDMAIAQEEIFGPVGVVIKFKDADDVVRMANQSVYGLGGGVYTKNIDTALDVARRVKTGRIWVNTYNQIPAGAPFGGIKQSGIGRETHKMILDSYTQAKNIMIDLTGKGSGFY
ncbi:MAG: aldehyde dehydrogenase family protein, partial [Peptostreptococcus sp.]